MNSKKEIEQKILAGSKHVEEWEDTEGISPAMAKILDEISLTTLNTILLVVDTQYLMDIICRTMLASFQLGRQSMREEKSR